MGTDEMSGGKAPKNKGDKYERDVVSYLLSIGIPASRLKRGNPTGDVLTVPDIVIECKDQKSLCLAAWIDQTSGEVEAAQARYGIVIVKRARKADVGRHYFVMEVEDGINLLREAGYLD